ncbi:DR2241 family protein [Luteolibacter marinus]|uniref:DR2241 family protein n=1 Tax=Luteolibacter marinus TaxID=2776705 RepID=UPI001865DD35|nr:DR2241 family protein [Luteolibacter marinus]
MKLAEQLSRAVSGGVRRIGQISIQPSGDGFTLRHIDDENADPALLETRDEAAAAREIATWADDGHYRFTKGELSLKRGWQLRLGSAAELHEALDAFYPAAAGLWFAKQADRLEVQHLRDKLNRQTGMYRFARNISDDGAQRLVREVCGPGHCCVKKILWQIDADTPLDDSEATRFDGVVGDINHAAAIPLLCREACNHFVAETRKAAKAEHEAAGG